MGAVMGRANAIPAPVVNAAGIGFGTMTTGADVMVVTRQARRLYVGNLPFGLAEVSFATRIMQSPCKSECCVCAQLQ